MKNGYKRDSDSRSHATQIAHRQPQRRRHGLLDLDKVTHSRSGVVYGSEDETRNDLDQDVAHYTIRDRQ